MEEHQLLGIIKREKERLFWRKLKYTMGKKSGGSVQAVQVEDTEGNIDVFNTQADIHEVIWSNIHRKRFYLAEDATVLYARHLGTTRIRRQGKKYSQGPTSLS